LSLITPSFMDKLLGADADASPRGAAMRMDLEQAKESVARDIETLLNARPTLDASAAARFPQVARSLLAFGLTDIASLSIASDRDRLRISEAIRRALADHERRLSQVEVAVVAVAAVGAGLRFSIRAQLRLTPASEPVAFDAVLHPGSKRYAISRSRPRAAAAP
jgi:type VI secretion system protein ImpF